MGSTIWTLIQLREQPDGISVLLTAMEHDDVALRSAAAAVLDPSSLFPTKKPISLTPANLSALRRLLEDERQIEFSTSFLPSLRATRVKDTAWRVLREHSQKTGERIYSDRSEPPLASVPPQ